MIGRSPQAEDRIETVADLASERDCADLGICARHAHEHDRTAPQETWQAALVEACADGLLERSGRWCDGTLVYRPV